MEVSRSGLYAVRNRQTKSASICPDRVHVKAAFEASGRSYGSRRLSQAFKAQDVHIGRHRARTLMRANALRSQWKRKFVHTTDSRHDLPVAANVLARRFNPVAPDQAWAVRHHVHPHSQRLAGSRGGAGSVLAPNRWLADGAQDAGGLARSALRMQSKT
jgi:transposase InsO family protein